MCFGRVLGGDDLVHLRVLWSLKLALRAFPGAPHEKVPRGGSRARELGLLCHDARVHALRGAGPRRPRGESAQLPQPAQWKAEETVSHVGELPTNVARHHELPETL